MCVIEFHFQDLISHKQEKLLKLSTVWSNTVNIVYFY